MSATIAKTIIFADIVENAGVAGKTFIILCVTIRTELKRRTVFCLPVYIDIAL